MQAEEPVPLGAISNDQTVERESKMKTNDVHIVDKIARILFPVVFVIFNIAYACLERRN